MQKFKPTVLQTYIVDVKVKGEWEERYEVEAESEDDAASCADAQDCTPNGSLRHNRSASLDDLSNSSPGLRNVTVATEVSLCHQPL